MDFEYIIKVMEDRIKTYRSLMCHLINEVRRTDTGYFELSKINDLVEVDPDLPQADKDKLINEFNKCINDLLGFKPK